MSKEKQQINEMALAICKSRGVAEVDDCSKCGRHADCLYYEIASALYKADYRRQSEGEWEWFEEWSPSTPDHPRECDECGWRCGKCKEALADVVGGYWDDPEDKPKLKYCPNCGAKMKGGE